MGVWNFEWWALIDASSGEKLNERKKLELEVWINGRAEC